MKFCLFGASSDRVRPVYISAVERLGRCLAKRGHTLVFGGGATGMMGAAARGAKSAGGRVIGISPELFRVDGVLFANCDEFIYTDSMHRRKELLREQADAFIVTPGGIGTYDEFFEVLTLCQIGTLKKPIALYNVDGCFEPLLALLESGIREKFLTEDCRGLYGVFTEAEALLSYLEEKVEKGEYAEIEAYKYLSETT